MSRMLGNKKGVALFMVIGTILVAVVLSNILLRFISSQYRLTHHQISRIQGYYAAMAGINYAVDNLRTGAWTVNSCLEAAGGCDLNDNGFPNTINQPVTIIIRPAGSAGCESPPGQAIACISATANYTPPS